MYTSGYREFESLILRHFSGVISNSEHQVIVKNSQQDIVINLHKYHRKIGIKISGGADSAILTYILSMYVKIEKPELQIVPITIVHPEKSYQYLFASKVIDFCKEKFGELFAEHQVLKSSNRFTHDTEQMNFVNDLYAKGVIDCHFFGVTKNPPSEVVEKMDVEGPSDKRDHEIPLSTQEGTSFRPFVNIDKKGIAELYRELNVLDSLFPLTRSCEELTQDFSKHCQWCWFCQERFWGFERYE